MLPPRNSSSFSSSVPVGTSHLAPNGGRTPVLRTFGAHAPVLTNRRASNHRTSHLTVLKLASLALPVSPSSHLTVLTLTAFAPRTFGARTPAVPAVVPPYGDSPTVHCTGFFLYFSCVVASTRNPSGFSRSGSSHLTALTLRFLRTIALRTIALRTIALRTIALRTIALRTVVTRT